MLVKSVSTKGKMAFAIIRRPVLLPEKYSITTLSVKCKSHSFSCVFWFSLLCFDQKRHQCSRSEYLSLSTWRRILCFFIRAKSLHLVYLRSSKTTCQISEERDKKRPAVFHHSSSLKTPKHHESPFYITSPQPFICLLVFPTIDNRFCSWRLFKDTSSSSLSHITDYRQCCSARLNNGEP